MARKETAKTLFVLSILVPALVGAEIPFAHSDPQVREFAPIEPVETANKAVLEMPKKRVRLDLFAGGTYLYDSNPNLVPNGEGTGVSVLDFGFDFNVGDFSQEGSHFQFKYVGTRFGYEDTAFRPSNGSLDHLLQTSVGLKKARTRFRLSSSYRRSNGNLTEYDELSRETRRAASDDLNALFSIHRELPRGSLEARLEYYSRSFDSPGLNDGTGFFGDIAWYYEPGFAPKSELGFGLRFGTEDFDGQFRQRIVTPSFRMRYRLSSKTSLDASFGYERRDLGGLGSQSIDTFVYTAGATWEASEKTRWELRTRRFVRPSYQTGEGAFESSDVILRLQQWLGRKMRLTASAGFEQADYFGTPSGVVSGSRQDDFFKAGISLGYPLKLGQKLDGSVDIFHQYNRNNSTDPNEEFEQNVTGIRFGFQF
ncbi:MAG: outer membrane beta-barrel protein [Verrucomicrobiota bacterium]